MTNVPEARQTDENLERRTTIQNEKTKLFATALNNTAVTLFAGGVVLPIVALSFPLTTAPPPSLVTGLMLGLWAFVAAGLHWRARSVLNGLR